MKNKPVKRSIILSGRREDILAMGRPAIEALLDKELIFVKESMLQELYPDD